VRRLRLSLALVLALPALAACGSGPARSSQLDVVAAESFWGSIASQLAGPRAVVHTIVVDPDSDPHAYEPTPSDARTMAGANVAIVNGIGYDNWATQLLAADPASGRVVVNAGDVLGLKNGDNPHQWYSPSSVRKVIAAITAAYERAEPSAAGYFAARRRIFETRSLARYDRVLAEIQRRFAGVPVGYSESIFQPLGEALGLRLMTPYGFAKAVAEGTEVSARDKQAVEKQLRDRRIAVWVYNSQNTTPEVQQANELAREHDIPIVTVTETLAPEGSSFQQWQVAQLERLAAALQRATGR
jgi:zinc/manganese transport system substrate-binding protein